MEENKHRKAQEWTERINQQKASGKSVLSWCREHSISYPTFLYWSKRLADNQTSLDPSSFTEINEEFEDVTWIEITFKGGKIILSRRFSPEALRYCLRILGKL